MTDPDLSARAEFLRHLAIKAADLARDGFASRNAGTFDLKGPQDFLTETDIAVETLIRDALSEAFPEDDILGEEGGGTPTPQLWIIDPIDGTANFARGVPHFCVCIAFALDGAPVLGAIIQPMTGEFWFAQKGKGAEKDGAPIRVTSTESPDTACIEMGWSRRHPVEGYLAAQRHVITGGANIRRGGSGALALAWVAEGRSDGYLEANMNCWDCLAGMLMIEEAGGHVRPFAGGLDGLANPAPVRACTPALTALLDEALALGAAT
ncbi:inositol monophosphatase family protein [Yoonia maritima]|uniref:inositol monophosphatase family protein n=1 Tax=Yoonia maritima TaxID=1435347 RepID=UPI000D0EE478|nr:inositol monophosphatase family protein [Yoonia maritima]